jgi:dihydrofolate synthase/folylpolyglutamate synthase
MAPVRESDVILERLTKLHPKLIDLSLDRIKKLLNLLGRPQDRMNCVIHVAGTNGKGSTIATLRALIEAMGLRVNVYTSPHLVSFNERIRLSDGLIAEEMLVDVLARCEAINDGAPITQFEMTTAAAFLAFADHPADVHLIETGLGGEFDATNIFASPACCVITPVDYDHMEYLGSTLGEIASAKAGILKRGVPAIIAPQSDEVIVTIEKAAARIGAPLKIGGQDWHASAEQGRFVFEDESGLLDLSLPRLAGRHQIINAGAALAVMRQMFPGVTQHQIKTGLNQVEWPARLQRLRNGPLTRRLPPGAELWLDGAHNPSGARALAEALADMEERSSRPLYLIIGIGANKAAGEILAPFAGLARYAYTLAIPDHLSIEPVLLTDMARRAGLGAEPASSLTEAIDAILEDSADPPRIVILGSLYLAGAVLAGQPL